MPEKFTVEIISPDRTLLKSETSEVIIPSYEGEMGILNEHIPLITFLRPGIIKIKDNEAFLLIKKTKKFKQNYFFLSKKGNLQEAAKNLYSTLRKIKKKKFSSIAVAKIPDIGLGKTINDRLKRASKY